MADLQAGVNEFVVTGKIAEQVDASKHIYNIATKRLNKKPPPPPPTTAELWAQVRAKRNGLLAQSDWTQLPDSPLTAAQKQAWAAYRQALRDITKQADPNNIQWPGVPV